MLRNYRDLQVWQKSYQQCLTVYRLTRHLPGDEKYGLVSQMRRAAVSVPSNIAEGYGRRSTAEYIRALRIAYGSNCELETQAMLCIDLGYLKTGEAKTLQNGVAEVERMLKALINAMVARRSESLESRNP